MSHLVTVVLRCLGTWRHASRNHDRIPSLAEYEGTHADTVGEINHRNGPVWGSGQRA